MSNDILNHITAGSGIVVTQEYGYLHLVKVSLTDEMRELPRYVTSHTIILDKLVERIVNLEAQVETLNQALEKMDAELCKYKPALELGMMYVAKQEFDEALKRI
jgi:hypothetical protein